MYIIGISFGLFFILSANLFSQQEDELKNKIDVLANNYIRTAKATCIVIGIFRKSENPHTNPVPEIFSYGVVKKNSDVKPDERTLIKMGSVGKTFTAAALAYLIQNNPDVKLDDPYQQVPS